MKIISFLSFTEGRSRGTGDHADRTRFCRDPEPQGHQA